MALIIEDGTIVANANSFITLAEARTFATARGVTLTGVDADLEVFVIKAMDYLIEFEPKLKGIRVGNAQTLMYPREGVRYYREILDDSAIPVELKNAQAQAVMEIASGIDPTPNGPNNTIKRNKVGPIEQEFFAGGASSKTTLKKVEVILRPLLKTNIGGAFGTVRI